MERVIFVEVLDRRGGVRDRQRFDRFPVSIGRALSCDLIVDDAHVSADHLHLEWSDEGSPVAVDQGSENGLFCPDLGRAERIPLESGRRLRIGRTTLRIRLIGEVLAPTVIETLHPGWLLRLGSNAVLAFGLAGLAVAAQILDRVSSDWSRQAPLELASAALLTAGVLAFLALAGGALTRSLRHEPFFLAHLSIASLCLIGLELSRGAADLVAFLGASIDAVLLGGALGTALIMTLGGYAALSVMGVLAPLERGLTAALGASLLVVAFGLGALNTVHDWVRELPYWSTLEPVPTALLPIQSADAFLADVADLEAELRRMAEPSPRS